MHAYRVIRTAVGAPGAARTIDRSDVVEASDDSSRGECTARVAAGGGGLGDGHGHGLRARLIAVLLAALCAPLALCASAHADTPCGITGVFSVQGTTSSCTYTTVGEDTFTVPEGVGALSVLAVGGRGAPGGAYDSQAGGAGGLGASVTASITPVASLLHVDVAADGALGTDKANNLHTCLAAAGAFVGGGAGGNARCDTGPGGGGGGASGIRTSADLEGSEDPRLIVAGGGGGGGGGYTHAGGAGGNAGATNTGAGSGGDSACLQSPATGSAGGVGAGGGVGGSGQGIIGFCVAANGGDGAVGVGGTGADGDLIPGGGSGGGGGGGGYHGGGAGATVDFGAGGGGGGGSSVGPSGSTFEPTDVAAQVVISWVTQPTFAFAGFFAPINDDALNVLKAGQAVPVKFSLDGDQGLDILDAGSPTSKQVPCESGLPSDVVEQTVTAGASSLTYDPATGTYTYTWKTDKAWANSCRELTVTLSDGTSHSALFKLTR
jgi:hypothetical protein